MILNYEGKRIIPSGDIEDELWTAWKWAFYDAYYIEFNSLQDRKRFVIAAQLAGCAFDYRILNTFPNNILRFMYFDQLHRLVPIDSVLKACNKANSLLNENKTLDSPVTPPGQTGDLTKD